MKRNIFMIIAVVILLFTLSACGNSDETVVVSSSSTVSESDMLWTPTIQNEEDSRVIVFVEQLSTAFKDQDIEAFRSLISTDTLPWVILYGGEEYVETAFAKPVSEFSFQNSQLIQRSPEVNPPEVDLGLSSDIFGELPVEYRIADEKDGFLENIDWNKADGDYMQAHFHSYYDQLAWMVDRPTYDGGWVVYKLTNDTYILTNGIGWYDETWSARVFAGQVFVIKDNDGKLGIIAYINAL